MFPHIIKQLAAEASTITLQLILYQETTIVNLLEVLSWLWKAPQIRFSFNVVILLMHGNGLWEGGK